MGKKIQKMGHEDELIVGEAILRIADRPDHRGKVNIIIEAPEGVLIRKIVRRRRRGVDKVKPAAE